MSVVVVVAMVAGPLALGSDEPVLVGVVVVVVIVLVEVGFQL